MQMTEAPPIACTFEGNDLSSRLAEIRALTERSLISHELVGSELHLVYQVDALVEVRRIVALEQRCCAFLDFAIEATPAEVRLTITPPAGSDEASGWLFAQFLPATAVAEFKPSTCGCSAGARYG
jgi:hypothetical protein